MSEQAFTDLAAALPIAHADWLVDAADLLAEPDPGPTPMLVDRLIVDGGLIACVGRWKTTKSYAMLDLSISVATGRPAFGQLAIREPGPVIFVNEESGKAALWRRLDALCRGRAIDPEELRGLLHVAPRTRRRLDFHEHQTELVELGQQLRPRLFVFDPLARMKDAARKENEQTDMAPLIEFMLELRDRTGAAIAFVHHTGHQGDNMRGSSDLETAWESRLSWKRDSPSSPTVKLTSEHRDDEGHTVEYRIAWDGPTRSMRFELDSDPIVDAVRTFLSERPDASANEVFKAVGGTRGRILELVKDIKEGGTEPPVPPSYRPLSGTPQGGTPEGLFRGLGTTTEEPGTNGAEPPTDSWLSSVTDEELERLAQDHADLAEDPA